MNTNIKSPNTNQKKMLYRKYLISGGGGGGRVGVVGTVDWNRYGKIKEEGAINYTVTYWY